jgi:hypothetical protein
MSASCEAAGLFGAGEDAANVGVEDEWMLVIWWYMGLWTWVDADGLWSLWSLMLERMNVTVPPPILYDCAVFMQICLCFCFDNDRIEMT